MNSLRFRPLVQQAIRQHLGRGRATMSTKAFPNLKKYRFKQEWLSDPSTYPLIVVMAGGFSFMFAMACNALFTYKQGVDIDPNKRGITMKPYSSEPRIGVVQRVATRKGGVNPEGLGIDHSEWEKKREQYRKE